MTNNSVHHNFGYYFGYIWPWEGTFYPKKG